MALPKGVQGAVSRVDRSLREWRICQSPWQTILAHLLSQDAEIADLIGKRDFLLRHYNLAESRLSAADALLQRTQMKDYDAAAWLRLGVEIQAHLSENTHG